MDRFDPHYFERKMAWELTHSESWRKYLKPLLERKMAQPFRKDVTKLDDAFSVCKDHAEMNFARYLLGKVELNAREFEYLGQQGHHGSK